MIRMPIWIALAIGLFAVVGIYGAANDAVPQEFTSALSAAALYDEDLVISLYAEAVPAVVEITALERYREQYRARSRSRRYRTYRVPTSQGSGFLIDNQGHNLLGVSVGD